MIFNKYLYVLYSQTSILLTSRGRDDLVNKIETTQNQNTRFCVVLVNKIETNVLALKKHLFKINKYNLYSNLVLTLHFYIKTQSNKIISYFLLIKISDIKNRRF